LILKPAYAGFFVIYFGSRNLKCVYNSQGGILSTPQQEGSMLDLPIGIFDSGMGGLTVLHELMRELPNERFVYLGDTARLPYGTKSAETVRQYAHSMTEILYRQGIKLLVTACNTATASALPYLREQYPDLPIMGVIEPGARAATRATKNKNILLLATETTINSQAYQQELLALSSGVNITTQACGLFVALAEEGCVNDAVSQVVIDNYLSQHKKTNYDSVILGCTHFPLFLAEIQAYMGADVIVINSALETACSVKALLDERSLHTDSNRSHETYYFVTDLPERFVRIGALFLGTNIHADAVSMVQV